MIWLTAVVIIILICFAGVLVAGAPYLPTLRPQVAAALKLVDLKPGQTLIELGCGDGKVLIAAAGQGLNVVGYELNPLLVAVAWLRTRRYHKQVRVIWGNFWSVEWPAADAIFTFLLPRYMEKLDKKCVQYSHKPLKLASFAFKIPRKHPAAEAKGVFLYTYD
jgi:16S rRNA A1518/A1519 N6-dimethyltransferase RsmA/KsgA/DIM1 with predicted DNA glycosylase/AP lyase activity